MTTPEKAVEFYKSVLAKQTVAIVIMMMLFAVAAIWYISSQDVTPGDIMQEVRIQGDILSKRQMDLKSELASLEAVNAERAAMMEKVSTSLMAIEDKISDHDMRLERIERDYILRAPLSTDKPDTDPPIE